MIYNIDIADGSVELKLLKDTVADINAKASKQAALIGVPYTPITETQYLTNLALAPLKKRVKQYYGKQVKLMDNADLEKKLGSISIGV